MYFIIEHLHVTIHIEEGKINSGAEKQKRRHEQNTLIHTFL